MAKTAWGETKKSRRLSSRLGHSRKQKKRDDVNDQTIQWCEIPPSIRLLEKVSREQENPLLPELKAKIVKREYKQTAKRSRYVSQFNQECESRFWGFPVEFSVEIDKRGKTREEKRLLARQSRKEMSLEDKASKKLRDFVKAEDKQLFFLLVSRWGALRGDIYCTSTLPGKDYLRLAVENSKRLQSWWRSQWHIVAVRRAEAAKFLQRLYMRTARRVDARKERKATQMLKRLRMSLVLKCFQTWTSFVKCQVQVRSMLQRRMKSTLRLTFDDWKLVVENSKLRKQKVQERTLRRFIHNRLSRVFNSWKLYTEKMVAVRENAFVHMTSSLRYCFQAWKDHYLQYVEYLKADQETGDNTWAPEQIDQATTIIQCIVRAYLAKCTIHRLRKSKERKRLVVSSRREHFKLLEAERKIREEKEVRKAIEECDHLLAIEVETAKGKTLLQEKTKAIVQSASTHTFSIIPRGVALRRMAFKDILRERRVVAEAEARQKFRLREPAFFEDD